MKDGKFKTISIYAITLTMLSCIYSCSKNNLINCEEHTVSDCDENANKTNLRIENVSDFDFCNVVLNPPNGNKNYGIINKGKITCYKSFDLAYNYAPLQLFIEDKEFRFQIIDYVGEQPLGVGKFTYIIDVIDSDKGTLSIDVRVD